MKDWTVTDRYYEALRENWARSRVAAAGKSWAMHRAKFDGTVVPSDPNNGWQYQGTTKIHFNGSSCTQIDSGSVKKITVRYGC